MLRKLPPLNALRAFDEVALAGSFKGAAKALNVTQSAISHQIKLLENHLGIFLFNRLPRGVTLTAAGADFQTNVHAAFTEIERGVRNLQLHPGPTKLTIQTYSTIAVRWLMPQISQFQKRHPKLQIRLVTSQEDPDFSSEAVDLAIVIGQLAMRRLKHIYLFTPTIFPVCTSSVAEKLHSLDDLSRVTILQSYTSAQDWRAWLNAQNLDEINPDIGFRFDSYDHALRMAARDHGVALAMQPYVEDDFATGTLVSAFPGREVVSPTSWYIACPESRAHDRYVRAFCQWLVGGVEQDPALALLRDPRHNGAAAP